MARDRVSAEQLVVESNEAIETLRRLAARLETYNDQLEIEIHRREERDEEG